MTKDEALDLALEALEAWLPTWPNLIEKQKAAIKAIKQARSAPVQKRPQNCGTGYCSCIECVMEPAPVQEPVAWGIIASNTGRICQVELDADEIEGHNPNHIAPLYTTPPAAQRQWVGLTDEAIWSEYQTLWSFHPAEEPRLAKDIAKFARAIEAKLKGNT